MGRPVLLESKKGRMDDDEGVSFLRVGNVRDRTEGGKEGEVVCAPGRSRDGGPLVPLDLSIRLSLAPICL